MRYALGLAEVEAGVKASCEEAAAQGWVVTVAVVDDSGIPIHISRMDEASPASVSTAIEKAASAALIGIETKILESLVVERPGLTTLGRACVEGGLPILHQRQRIGGIGVSGVQSSQDAYIANIGLQKILALIAG